MDKRWGLWGSVKTTWSDDVVTISEPMPYRWCAIDLNICGMEDCLGRPWGATRPVRAIIVDVHMWPEEDIVE